jgi:uncharacterized membrane protein
LPDFLLNQVAANADWTQIVKDLTSYLAVGIEIGAGLIIGVTALQAIYRAFVVFLRPTKIEDNIEAVRLRLGRWLSLALEFALAADILRTAVAPTWDEIGKLAAIVLLRTVLNYFLQMDIDKAERRGMLPGHAERPQGAIEGS